MSVGGLGSQKIKERERKESRPLSFFFFFMGELIPFSRSILDGMCS